MSDWRQEIRYSARGLAQTPAFTAVAVLSLALGIGVNTAVLAVGRAVLLTPLPVPEPDRLVVACWWRGDPTKGMMNFNTGAATDPRTGKSLSTNYDYGTYVALREATREQADRHRPRQQVLDAQARRGAHHLPAVRAEQRDGSDVRRGARPRAHRPPEELRRAVAEVDRDVPVTSLKTQTRQIDETIGSERTLTLLLVFFGIFALLLACMGLHGVTAYAVARRTNEIGIRLALGAQRRTVLWLVLRQVVLLAAGGLLIGIPAAAAGSRAVQAYLFGVEPADPWSIALGAAVLFSVALAAGLIPARRASRMDPLAALPRVTRGSVPRC